MDPRDDKRDKDKLDPHKRDKQPLTYERLEQFIALAEDLHFGRAAERLGLDQPALSRSIRRLETDLGVDLLRRTTRSIGLTESGTVFLAEARKLVTDTRAAVHLTRRVAGLGQASLHIGFPRNLLSQNFLPRAFRAFRAKWPTVRLNFSHHSTVEQRELLLDGRLDLGVNTLSAGAKGLTVAPILRSKYIAVVPATWPIAQKASLRLADLEGYPFIPPYRADLHAQFVAACRKAGFEPNLVEQMQDGGFSYITSVASGIAAALQPEAVSSQPIDGVKCMPIVDLPEDLMWDLAIAWVGRGVSKPLADLVEVILAQAGKAQSAAAPATATTPRRVAKLTG